ncbi:MAG: flagellar M-ring protein FliF [Nitrosomonas sp.]|nr:flagellar M-ring protein FliF [Nitrosomonas sp.]MBK7365851.1 flagellar M-ring protein FliF [Nitrosomonas sp.]
MATVSEDIGTKTNRFSTIAQLSGQKKLGLMLAAAASIALLVGIVIWSQSPDYRVLYTNITEQDGGAVINALQQMNIPYQFSEGNGTILVPGTQVHEIRLRLASQGLPKGGISGFELLENQKFGSSQFLEQVNYQRALEGELARSIQSLSAVQSARIHLAIAKPTVFVRERQQPSVSVLLNLYPGRVLTVEQISAIIHLVSSSIPNLPVKNVTVVDQNGNLLSTPKKEGNETGLDDTQLKYIHELEQNINKRIETILLPITGPNNVRAQVTADVDFSRTERAEEIYKPNNIATEAASIRSQQKSDSMSANRPESGVPGALSNRPPAAAEAPVDVAAGEGDTKNQVPVDTRSESTTNYELDKTIQHTRQSVGRINRLSAAVVINYRGKMDEAGSLTHEPLAAEEIEKINSLVKQAMGFDENRGDSLTVTNSQFNILEEDIAEIPFWKQPDMILLAKEIGKQLIIAALVLFFLLKILKPFLKSLLPPPPPPPAQLQATAELDENKNLALSHQQETVNHEQNITKAKQLALNEPIIVANVIKEWVSDNER